MIDPNEIEETVPLSHHDVRLILGTAHCDDPDQATRRIVHQCGVPHLRLSDRRIRFSLPALRQWVAERIANSVEAGASTK